MQELNDRKIEILSDLINRLLHEHAEKFNKIESKIDMLADTVVSLARAEEKLIALESSRLETQQKLEATIDKVDRVEEVTSANAVTLGMLTKLFWILTAAGTTFALSQLMQ